MPTAPLLLTPEQIRERARAVLSAHGAQAAAARDLRVSAQTLRNALSGTREASRDFGLLASILIRAGYRLEGGPFYAVAEPPPAS